MTSTVESVLGSRSWAAVRRSTLVGPVTSHRWRYVGLMMVFFILIKPSMVDQDPGAAPVIKALTGLVFAGVFFVHCLRRIPLSATLVLFVLYRWVMLLPTVLNSGDLLNWGYVTITQLTILMVLEIHSYASTDAKRRLLRVLTDLLLAYLVINYVMILMGWSTIASWGNDFLAQPSYLLGIRTRVTDTIFPATLLAMLYDSTSSGRWGRRTVIALIMGVVQIATLQVATAAVGALCAALVYWLVMTQRRLRGVVSMRGATIMGLVVTFLVVVVRVQVSFQSVIHDTLGKDISLTGRTVLWDTAVPVLERSPLVGYGVNWSFGAFVPWVGGVLWQAHNQYLQIAYDSGLLGLGLFVLMMWVASTRADRATLPLRARAALVSVYAGLSLMCVTEIYVYNMALFYLVVFLASRAGDLVVPAPRRCSG